MNKYIIPITLAVYVIFVLTVTIYLTYVINKQKALIELQKHEAELLNKKIQVLEAKLKPINKQ
jgi:hypothetical protein